MPIIRIEKGQSIITLSPTHLSLKITSPFLISWFYNHLYLPVTCRHGAGRTEEEFLGFPRVEYRSLSFQHFLIYSINPVWHFQLICAITQLNGPRACKRMTWDLFKTRSWTQWSPADFQSPRYQFFPQTLLIVPASHDGVRCKVR